MLVSPLKFDRARLVTLRRVMATNVRRRFALLRRVVGANDWSSPFLADAGGRMDAFRNWLSIQAERIILADRWWTKHLRAAWLKGADRAFDDVRRPALRDTGTVMAERSEFHRRLERTASRVAALAARFSNELQGAVDLFVQRTTRAVAGSLVTNAAAPFDEALRRALLAAQSELQRAFSEGQLDGLEELDVASVGLLVEWETTSGNPCRRCEEMAGETYAIDEARGLIPLHVNCLCVWIVA